MSAGRAVPIARGSPLTASVLAPSSATHSATTPERTVYWLHVANLPHTCPPGSHHDIHMTLRQLKLT